MKYNEWVTQLNANLLSVSEAERRKVLDYYAEAYADRRAAGFSENEIIDGFGAPYDAAQAILENDNFTENTSKSTPHYEQRKQYYEQPDYEQPRQYSPPPSSPPPAASQPAAEAKVKNDYTWVFVILCIVLAVPLFSLIMTMVGVTIGFAVAPFCIVATGAGLIVGGIWTMFSTFGVGLAYTGIGLIVLGVGIPLFKLFFSLVKLMWKLFGKFFKWLSGLFKGGVK